MYDIAVGVCYSRYDCMSSPGGLWSTGNFLTQICPTREKLREPWLFEKRRLGGTLSVQIMESSSLEILKTWQHGSEELALVNLALSSGVGLYDLQRPLTTSAILWILGVNFEDTEMVMSFFMSSQLSLPLTPEYQKTNIPKSAVRWSNNKVHTSILNTKHLWGF